jgi:tRNA(fMet)-specific endonuclease VapC
VKYMLDTNICIYIIKHKPKAVIERFLKTELSHIGLSSITMSELTYGVHKSATPEQNQIALAQFLAPLEIWPYGDEAAHHYGSLSAYLEKMGTPIGSLDTLIAAHALSIPCSLVTNNTKEFSRVPGLRLDNWASLG